jgi:hypothetical protein
VGILLLPLVVVYALEREAKRAWLALQRPGCPSTGVQWPLYLGLLFAGCLASDLAVDAVLLLQGG